MSARPGSCRLARALLLLVLGSIALGLWSLAGIMYPLRQGTPKEFWSSAFGVALDGADGYSFGTVYMPRADWCIYAVQAQHGQELFRVPRTDAWAVYPDVLEAITEERQSSRSRRSLERVRSLLTTASEEERKDPVWLLSRLRAAEALEFDRDARAEEERLTARLDRIQGYWINVVFEALYLSGLALFAFWPWLSPRPRWRRALHLALVPFLLFLPWFLGYCGLTLTSAGPCGGILYPWLIGWTRGFPLWTRADEWLLERTPAVLADITQTTGDFLSLSGGHGLGPIGALVVGSVIFAAVMLAPTHVRLRRQAR